MITKRVQILEILYPKGIQKEQYSQISKIFGLIDHLIEETKDHIKHKEQIKTYTMQEALEEVKEKTISSKPIDYFPVFIETNQKDAPTFSKAQRVDYGGIYLLKWNRHYKIVNKHRRTIIATLDYLLEYYDKLPHTFCMDDIEGIGDKKARLLMNFYLLNTQFKNHEEINNNKKYIIKDI